MSTTWIDIYLDDLRSAPHGFTLVRTIEECLLLMEATKVRRLSLDYNLGAGRTADEVTKWIVQTGRWPREIFFHSSDFSARRRMHGYLEAHAPGDVVLHKGTY